MGDNSCGDCYITYNISMLIWINNLLTVTWCVFCSEKVTSCLANIHSFVLRDCAQLPWAGDLSEEININQVKVEKKKDQQIVKFLPAKLPNLPYSKVILQERIK